MIARPGSVVLCQSVNVPWHPPPQSRGRTGSPVLAAEPAHQRQRLGSVGVDRAQRLVDDDGGPRPQVAHEGDHRAGLGLAGRARSRPVSLPLPGPLPVPREVAVEVDAAGVGAPVGGGAVGVHRPDRPEVDPRGQRQRAQPAHDPQAGALVTVHAADHDDRPGRAGGPPVHRDDRPTLHRGPDHDGLLLPSRPPPPARRPAPSPAARAQSGGGRGGACRHPRSACRGSVAASPVVTTPVRLSAARGPPGGDRRAGAGRPPPGRPRHAAGHGDRRAHRAAADRQRQRADPRPLPAAVLPARPLRPRPARPGRSTGAPTARGVLGARGQPGAAVHAAGCCAGGCARRRRRWGGIRSIAAERPDLVQAVRDEVKDRSVPMTAGQVEAALEHDVPRAKVDWGWNWSEVKRALEFLFYAGEISSAGRTTSFERRYAVPERVLPRAVLDAADPTDEEAFLELTRIAARAHGVASEPCLRDYFRLRPVDSQAAVATLVETGELLPVEVEGWGRPGYLHRDARLPRRVDARALLVAVRPAGVVALAGRAPVRLPLPDRDLRSGRQAGARLLRAAVPARRAARRARRPQGRPGCRRPAGAVGVRRGPRPARDGASSWPWSCARWPGWLDLDDVVVEDRGDLARGLAVTLGRAPRPS